MQLTAIRWATAIGIALASATPLLAQSGVARLSHADRSVMRTHRAAPAPATIGVSLMDGDQIETVDGRAEVTFPDGTIVHLDTHTRLGVYSGERLHLVGGRLFVRTSGVRTYVADTSAGRLRILAAGVSEVTARAENLDVLLRVVSGSARVECPWGNQPVNAYQAALVSGPSCRPFVSKWMPPQTDDFERWASARTVMATSTAIGGTEGGGGMLYGPYYGGWYYSEPQYVYYPVLVEPPVVGPVHSRPYYAAPVYANPYYGNAYPYAHPAYRWSERSHGGTRRAPETGFVPPYSAPEPAPPPAPTPSRRPVRSMTAGAVVRPPS